MTPNFLKPTYLTILTIAKIINILNCLTIYIVDMLLVNNINGFIYLYK